MQGTYKTQTTNTMRLYLTSYNLANCSYCTRDGKTVYKVSCSSSGLGEITATIWRSLSKLEPTPEEVLWAEKHFGDDAIPHPSVPYTNEEPIESYRKSLESQDDELLSWAGPPPTVDDYKRCSSKSEAKQGLTNVAEIEMHSISSTVIRHLGNEWKASEFFSKAGWGWYGSDRIFKGPDDNEYRWKMGPAGAELFLVDTDPKEERGKAHVPLLVARFSNAELNGDKLPAFLEIFPAGEDMADWILITFIYVEMMRKPTYNRYLT
ncbi:hypothetical protein BDN70DRAFT_855358 [Pholiota conissans]|uniref:DUF6593 domain-containing protein n=1 Tax=Pholiota conissans TaxID=109636 RepID=A0A9P5Z734_9AGAR|nr:hypothetical protein BDN70DRAFT_855358 [Pholiota conissans]